jgi:serine/threonine protein kinase
MSSAKTPSPAKNVTMSVYETRSVRDFAKLDDRRIGEGTYGTVYRARDKQSNEIVALKKLKMDRETRGFPLTSVREINILLNLAHPNIVKLLDVTVGRLRDKVFLVFEYCDHDLATVLDGLRKPFREDEVKTILHDLASAIAYLHDNFIVHRDLKLSNLLMDGHGKVKIADFGLARTYSHPLEAMTPKVVTLWYRAPELLLGASKYHTAVDCWSLACIFGELLRSRPILPGKSEMQQIQLIFKLLGTPTDRIWPGYGELPVVAQHASTPSSSSSSSSSLAASSSVKPLPDVKYNSLSKVFPDLSANGLDLLGALFTYDPSKRMTAAKALVHPFFRERPPLCTDAAMQTMADRLKAAQGKNVTTTATSTSSSSSSSVKSGASVINVGSGAAASGGSTSSTSSASTTSTSRKRTASDAGFVR